MTSFTPELEVWLSCRPTHVRITRNFLKENIQFQDAMQGSDDCFQTSILAKIDDIVAFFNLKVYMFQKSELCTM
jgi:hypothetical protein